jgi:hypothetical protein
MDLRLDDPDPRIRDLATIAFLDDVFGRGFLLRWAKMNNCEERIEERLSELEMTLRGRIGRSPDRADAAVMAFAEPAKRPVAATWGR